MELLKRGTMLAFKIAVPIIAAGLIGAGCVQHKTALQHYDACANEGAGFAAMVECGRGQRAAYCVEYPRRCGADGDSVVRYGDALLAQARSREISEGAAMAKGVEFRQTTVHRARQEAAAAAAAAPTTCTRVGDTVTCN